MRCRAQYLTSRSGATHGHRNMIHKPKIQLIMEIPDRLSVLEETSEVHSQRTHNLLEILSSVMLGVNAHHHVPAPYLEVVDICP